MKTTDSSTQMSSSSSPTHAIFFLITLCVLSGVSCFWVTSSSYHLTFQLRLVTGISLCSSHRARRPGLSGLCRFTLYLLKGTNPFSHKRNTLGTTVRKLRLPCFCQPAVFFFYSIGRQIFFLKHIAFKICSLNGICRHCSFQSWLSNSFTKNIPEAYGACLILVTLCPLRVRHMSPAELGSGP